MLIDPLITVRQREIIISTILGGSSIVKPAKGKNCYLSMRSKNNLWLEYKGRELQILASPAPFTIESTFRWHSLCYPLFAEFQEMFYRKGERRLDGKILDPLRDVGLAIWFGDCGHYLKGHVTLNTHIWGESGSKVIKKYFQCLGYKPEITKERGCFRVRLDKASSETYLRLIVPQLPAFIVQEIRRSNHADV